jgi:hypothetical protein
LSSLDAILIASMQSEKVEDELRESTRYWRRRFSWFPSMRFVA